MNKTVCTLSLVISLLLMTGCAQTMYPRYPAGTAGTAMQVSEGRIVAIEVVTIEGDHSLLGTVGGAVVGNSIGRTLGGGSGRRVAGAVGGVVGAVTGRAVERRATSQVAVEIVVKLNNGGVVAIIQEDDQVLRVGDRVRVMRGRRTSRVAPA